MKHRISLLILLLIAPSTSALVGCSSQKPTDSRDIATADIRVTVAATDVATPSPHTHLVATLGGPGANVTLVDGDRVDVTLAGTTQTLIAVSGAYGVAYAGDFPPSGGVALFTFLRAGSRTDDQSVIGSFVVPPPFPLTAPTGDVSRKTDLTFTWPIGPGGYATRLTITGTCFFGLGRELAADLGTYTLNAGELRAATGHEGETCVGTIALTHDATGRGTIYASSIKTETSTFQSAP